MRTILTQSTAVAARFIRDGQLVAFPTETVFGVGADVSNPAAVAAIFEAKQRPADNPLIVHLSNVNLIETVVAEIPPIAKMLIGAFCPGPITLLLQRAKDLPDIVTAGSELVGIRVPDHPLALEFLERCGTPIAAPSANRSGLPSPTTWEAVYSDLAGRIACILQGRPTSIGLESTVVDVSGDTPVVMRPGAITLEDIVSVVGSGRPAGHDDQVHASPGTRHKHYAPAAAVILVKAVVDITMPLSTDAYIGLSHLSSASPIEIVRYCQSVEEYASTLYDFFRECDRKGVRRIWCESVVPEHLGTALMDRLVRAASR